MPIIVKLNVNVSKHMYSESMIMLQHCASVPRLEIVNFCTIIIHICGIKELVVNIYIQLYIVNSKFKAIYIQRVVSLKLSDRRVNMATGERFAIIYSISLIVIWRKSGFSNFSRV